MKVQDLRLFENRKFLDLLGRVCNVGEEEYGNILRVAYNGFLVHAEFIETDQNPTIDEFLQRAFVIKQREIERLQKEDKDGYYSGKYIDYETALKQVERKIIQEQRERATLIEDSKNNEDEARKEFLFLQSKKQPAIYDKKYYSGDELDKTTFYNGKTRKKFYEEKIEHNKHSNFIDKAEMDKFKHLKIADVTTTVYYNILAYRILNDIITNLLKRNNLKSDFTIDPFKIKTSIGDIEFGLEDEVSLVLSKLEELLKSQLKDKESMQNFKSIEDIIRELPQQYIQEAKENAEIDDFESSDSINKMIELFNINKSSRQNRCFRYKGEMFYICDTSSEEFEKRINELQQRPSSPPPPSNMPPPPLPSNLRIDSIEREIKKARLTTEDIKTGYDDIQVTMRGEELKNIESSQDKT